MKVFIGSAIWREVDAEHAYAMRMLCIEMLRRGIPWTDGSSIGDALVSRARSIIASNFVRSDADVLLSIDGDIVFEPEDAIRICEGAMTHGLVGGVYVTRADAPRPAVLLPDEIVFAEGQPLAEVRWLSTGFLAVHRQVLVAMAERLNPNLCAQASPEPFWPFYMPFVLPDPREGKVYLSEDWAMCERAKADGHHCYIDPTVRLEHKGAVGLRLEDMLRPMRLEPQAMLVQTNGDTSFSCFVQQEGTKDEPAEHGQEPALPAEPSARG